jgi:hypothetical protein
VQSTANRETNTASLISVRYMEYDCQLNYSTAPSAKVAGWTPAQATTVLFSLLLYPGPQTDVKILDL